MTCALCRRIDSTISLRILLQHLGIFDKRITDHMKPASMQFALSEIPLRELVECFALPLISLHCRRVDRTSISIKGEKQTCLVGQRIRLESFERIFGYKERPLHRAVMSPKPNSTPCWIENPALV